MEFERFLNKYLNGSLSDDELEQFRALLDRSPHYRDELRQTLDLRSAIQDDALHLTPPESLSERVRLSVAASFADARIGDRPAVVEEKRRRVIWSPYRMAGMVAAIMAIAIPFGPEVFKGGAARRLPQAPDMAMSVGTASGSIGSGPASRSSATRASEARSSESVTSETTTIGGSERSAAGDAAVGDAAALAALSPSVSLESSVVADVAETRRSAESSGSGVATSRTESTTDAELPAEGLSPRSLAFSSDNMRSLPAELSVSQGIFERSGLIGNDLQAMLKPRDIDALRGYSISSEPTLRRDERMLASSTYNDPFAQPTPGSGDSRLLTVGVTLGSGQVSKAKSATALLQNSYYFAVSVSSRDRIGIEMGASAFEQVRNVISYGGSDAGPSTAKRTAPAKVAGFGKRSGTNPGEGTDVARLPDNFQGDFNFTPESDMVSPIGEYNLARGYVPVSQGHVNDRSGMNSGRSVTLVEQRMEQQITYGAVFYDHRVQLLKELDLCGRLAVGGADDAIVGGLRAYAAYSPSKTLTFTLGVGGSTLYNLTQHQAGASSNYGVYYGIETGF